MTRTWTSRERKILGRLFDRVAPDHEGAFGLAIQLSDRLARALPSTYDGIELMPLLVHKLAVYNADLVGHSLRFLRAERAAAEMLARRGGARYVFPFADQFLAEHCFGAGLRSSGGRFTPRKYRVADGSALAARYGARGSTAGYERFEADLTPTRSAEPGATACPVLFVASMNNYLNPMLPVIAALAARGENPAVLTVRGAERWPAMSGLADGAARLTLGQDATTEAFPVFMREQARYTRLWDEHAASIARVFEIRGVSLWPLVATDVERFVKDYFPYAIAMIESGRALADRLAVKAAAIARLRRTTELGLVAGLRSRGVAVTMLMHGHVSNFPERRFDAGSFAEVDRVCVWGPDQARQVERSAWPAPRERIVPIGNPAWDGLISRKRTGREQLRRELAQRLDLDPRCCWGVLTTQALTTRQFEDVVEAFARNDRCALIVKVHPAEDPEWYRRRAERLPAARVLAHADVDLHDLLAAGDCTLTFSSTTNLESLLLGTPVVTYVFGDLAAQDRAVYLERYGLPLARDTTELEHILRAARADADAFRAGLAPAMRAALDANLASAGTADAAARAAAFLMSDAGDRTAVGSVP